MDREKDTRVESREKQPGDRALFENHYELFRTLDFVDVAGKYVVDGELVAAQNRLMREGLLKQQLESIRESLANAAQLGAANAAL